MEGRFIKGNTIQIDDVFIIYKEEDSIRDVHCKVVDILMFNKSILSIDVGMTGRLILECSLFYNDFKDSFELISSVYNKND